MLDHTRLDVYRASLDLLDQLDSLGALIPAGRGHLRDQLDRAATSVVLNIAEGAGEFSGPDKKRFYRMARRSTIEVAAVVDILEMRGVLTVDSAESVRQLLVRIVSMLVRLIER